MTDDADDAPARADDAPARADDELARAAEAEAAAAEARAEAARARADELRTRLHANEQGPAEAAPQPMPRRGRQTVAATTAVVTALVLSIALLAATGWMTWQHRQNVESHQRAAEYAAAARQGVVNLMSIDYATAQDSVQRVLDGSSGRFRDNFAETAEEFVEALQAEKIVTKATVNDAAVETMSADSAVVLISATSRREGRQAPEDQQQPRLWRIVLTMVRDGDQIKMSGVEFV